MEQINFSLLTITINSFGIMKVVYKDTECSVYFITLYQVQMYCLHKNMLHRLRTRGVTKSLGYQNSKTMFLNRRAAARYRVPCFGAHAPPATRLGLSRSRQSLNNTPVYYKSTSSTDHELSASKKYPYYYY